MCKCKECTCEKPKAHPHAALMAEYAKDAAETDKPWERWQYKSRFTGEWKDLYDGNPGWGECMEYRRKPKDKKAYFNVYPGGGSSSWWDSAEAQKFSGANGLTVEVNFTTKSVRVL